MTVSEPRGPGALRHPAFARYWLARFLASFSVQIVSVAIGWQVYDMTRDPKDLGFIGLVQFLPSVCLVLVTGAVADRFSRRGIVAICLAGEVACAAALLLLTLEGVRDPVAIFVVLAIMGTLRAFFGPAQQSLMVNLVPATAMADAIAWSTTSWQIATILGPVAGGLLYGLSATTAYGTAVALLALATALALSLPATPREGEGQRTTWSTLMGGFSYLSEQKIVLGAISFDLFAVLLGGATALLPIYARDILEVGPWGLGLLRSGPGIGAILVAAFLLRHPIRDHAGPIMFVCVAFFGVFTIIFGASTLVWLSVLALMLMGGFDMVSVYVRETLIQLWTPDALRGRVNAVNQVFLGASNELGEFRAGLSAGVFGAVPAVVIGGLGTIGVAALWTVLFPSLRRARRLDGPGEGAASSDPA